MGLPQDVETSYTTIIDAILATSDLNTISEKRIRKGLQAIVQHDITPQKAEIKELIMARFDKFNAERNSAPASADDTPVRETTKESKPKKRATPEPLQQASPPTSGTRNEEDEDGEDLFERAPVKAPKKKVKTEPMDNDARYAAMLQAEENGRARATRGAPSRKNGVVRKNKKKVVRKSPSKLRTGDDSDLESGSGLERKKAVNRSGGFHKPLTLSTPLSNFLGETMIVKRIWAYVKERDLQDPNDRRMIRCDEALKTVFKQDRVHMFTMNKLLTSHVFAPGE